MFIVDDDDFPLIIKVASLPDIRMQVYFLDNDDFFKGREIFPRGAPAPFFDRISGFQDLGARKFLPGEGILLG